MRTVMSASGREEAVVVRRSESADAEGIDSLIGPSAVAVFGRVNVIHLLEKANLAVTLANEREDILAHASFFDHPIGDLVDQAHWEPFLQKHFSAETCTPWNTLFLHIFLAQPDFAAACIKEIMRAVFNAVTELQHICLVSPNLGSLEPALEEVFEPLQRRKDPGRLCLAFICCREEHSPQLLIRTGRVEDYDDIMCLNAERENQRPSLLAEILEAQDEKNSTLVCESGGLVVGLMRISAQVDMTRLNADFECDDFGGFYRREEVGARRDARPEETQSAGRSAKTLNAVCIQDFIIDKNYVTRSADFISYIFNLYPDLDFCIVSVPMACPKLPLLLQSFLRRTSRASSWPPQELYVLPRAGHSGVEVRPAVAADRPALCDLVKDLRLSEALLQDLDRFYESRRDPGGAALQAFVAQHGGQLVGTLILRDEQDAEYICAHYNIENFIYFSHHRREELAQIRHLVLKSSFQHLGRHLFKEVLRLAGRSCLFHRMYPSIQGQERTQNSCIHHLDVVLDYAVPVRPRRQILYPLEELGINAPSRRITEHQAPFALSLISRKLTLEPKVTVNARIVVVGASNTGLSFLEVLCLCPHLRFYSLTLVSTHGFPGDHEHDDVGFLSTSHAYSRRDLAQLPLQSCVATVTGKMVGINRKSKLVLVSGGVKLPYDHLVLCTGLQYQVPGPPGVDLQPNGSRYTGPVPANLLTLNDLQDCAAARRWLLSNFVELEDNAVVYGDGIDVFTATETLLRLGVRGSRIHLVLPPPGGGDPRLGDPVVEGAVATALKEAEVQVHRHCLLTRMDVGGDDGPLTSVSFASEEEPLRLQCGVFINLSNKGVDYDAFRSINNSFLPFDGRLVIDATFRTCDSHVYGAGPLTKFSRRYYADEWSHGNFNSKEVGQDLAAMLLPLFDPTLQPEAPPERDRLVPLYTQAKIRGERLPGGLNYLHVTKPSATYATSPPVTHLQDRGIVTGRAETGNYFSLRLDRYDMVDELTCLSLKPLPFSNYLCLFGKHQQLLGQLSSRYRQGLIHDLYSFFRQSWCLAIYHDRFSDFEQELQQMTSNAEDGRPRDAAALRSSAARYLSYNRNLLPMFARPGQL
uniref:Cilia- and flagella-associated protein 61 N-terminal domain-containing protein n=1 Tax=Gasterosteus aculeatus aculeatus TaxID=481459 RepID=G3PDQ1_GASAC|nr:cilia- and flagella-associated protein 61 isoform X2 [Gasterosteus aculeatus aculeatus]